MNDPTWMAAFMSQATDKLRRRAQRYATQRAGMVAQYGGRGDSSYAEDLVEDVLADVLIGTLSWRPDASSLMELVLSAIQSRSRHDRDRAVAYPQVALLVGSDDDDDPARALLLEIESALAQKTASVDPEQRFFTAELVSRLYELAADDAEVSTMIDAMCNGATERADLMELLAMDARAYDRVRHRFDRLLSELPARCLASAGR